MKSYKYKIGTLLLGLGLLQAHASVLVNDPSGLNIAINSNTTTIDQEAGNTGIAAFNALGERVALTFEITDGYNGVAPNNSGNLDRVELLESEGSPLDLRVNFGSNAGFRVVSTFNPTGGSDALVYQGTANSATLDFINPLSPTNAQPVTGVAFTANRLEGDMTVSLYSDLARTTQIGSSFTIFANSGGSNHSFFGYYDESASIASVVLNSSAVGQFSIDDLNITTIPEPSTMLMLLIGATVIIPLHFTRRNKKA